MPSKKPQINARVTDDQIKALDRAIKATNMERSEFIRSALAHYIRFLGMTWPDNMPMRGTYERDPKDE